MECLDLLAAAWRDGQWKRSRINAAGGAAGAPAGSTAAATTGAGAGSAGAAPAARKLPKTASSWPLLGLASALMVVLAFGLTLRRRFTV